MHRRNAREKTAREEQETFGFMRHGGARRGAGPKRKAAREQVSHRTRERVTRHEPMHVTVRLVDGTPSLRTKPARSVIEEAIGRANARGRIRVVHFTAQRNHMHLIVEANARERMSNGMQGLLVSLAKRLNRLWERAGTVFSDRYHDVILRTPSQVRNALRYVLKNHMHHDGRRTGLDPFASGAWFDGWRGRPSALELARAGRRVVADARSWLLKRGWRRRGLIRVDAAPGSE